MALSLARNYDDSGVSLASRRRRMKIRALPPPMSASPAKITPINEPPVSAMPVFARLELDAGGDVHVWLAGSQVPLEELLDDELLDEELLLDDEGSPQTNQ
jgi:hypothetical protein